MNKLLKSVVSQLVRYVDVKSSVGVHLYAERRFQKLKQTPDAGTIRFNVAYLNTGNTMNLTTGVFTASVNGTYHLQRNE